MRGAPCIGVFGAYGVALLRARIDDDARVSGRGATRSRGTPDGGQLWRGRSIGYSLRRTRCAKRARSTTSKSRSTAAIGDHGLALIPKGARVLDALQYRVHWRRQAGGTALGVIIAAQRGGKKPRVFVDETRPLLQGSRLNYYELREAGVDAVLIADAAAAITMKEQHVDLAIVGADRIARNGDTANKIGTYGLAILCAHHGIPFYVAAPRSTFDFSIDSGAQIPIEERPAEEVASFAGTRVAPDRCRRL